MAKKTNAKTTVKDAVAKKETKVSTPKKSTKKVEKKQLVEAIFLNKKSKDLLERGKFPASLVENNPTLYFKNPIDAQSNAKHYLDEIKDKLKQEKYAELKLKIELFS